MNNALDPFIHRMRNAESDKERASILLEAPVFTLARLRGEFSALCRRAAFDEGPAYIDALIDALSRPRHIGDLGGDHEALRVRLLYIATPRERREAL
ncbi:hypothetical protein [Mesorhizobium sp. KR9-304]|uniref:hypothetical protein n=1 Tax=Mesorhizobium sp. KR9-304 TaxID=3156614 RepID=UPI0032B3F7F1